MTKRKLSQSYVRVNVCTLLAECMSGIDKGKLHVFWKVIVSVPTARKEVEIYSQTPFPSHRAALEGLLVQAVSDPRILPEIRDDVVSLTRHILETRQYEKNDLRDGFDIPTVN